MDTTKVMEIIGTMVDFLIKLLKGLKVISTDEEVEKSDAYKSDIENILTAIGGALKKED